MPRNILQDIVKKNQHGIRQIPIPERGRHRDPPSAGPVRERPQPEGLGSERLRPEEINLETGQKKRHQAVRGFSLKRFFPRRKLYRVLFILILLLGFGWLAAALGRSEATVTLYPKKFPADISVKLSIKKGDLAKEFAYDIVSVSRQTSVSVPATGEKEVERRAEGTIIIYNNFSREPQRLIVNTRFETQNGLIYRLPQSLVVPGRTTRSGKTVAGSIEAKVRADSPGEKYNIGLTDFTVPGFKGTPRFDGFYARSKTPMKGGFIGKVKVVDEKLVAAKRSELRAALESEARLLLTAGVASSNILYPSSVVIAFESITDNTGPLNTATVKEKVIAAGILFNRLKLAGALAAGAIDNFSGGPVRLEGIEALKVVTDLPEGTVPNPLSVTFKGSGIFVAELQASEIAAALSGKPKKNFNEVLLPITGINRAEAAVRPLWSANFPKNPSRINIKIVP